MGGGSILERLCNGDGSRPKKNQNSKGSLIDYVDDGQSETKAVCPKRKDGPPTMC